MATASADMLVPAAPGTFHLGWSANNDGAEFWDNTSVDGTRCNVGFWMLGTASGCSDVAGASAISPTGTHAFFASLSPDTNISGFTLVPTGVGRAATLQVEVTGLSGANVFGFYQLSNPGVLVGLFGGSVSPIGGPVAFTPTGPYAFFLRRADGTVFTTAGDAAKHFALFSDVRTGTELTSYFVAVEDGADRDDDFNDMIVRVSTVPEPGTLALLGLGIAAVAARRLRR